MTLGCVETSSPRCNNVVPPSSRLEVFHLRLRQPMQVIQGDGDGDGGKAGFVMAMVVLLIIVVLVALAHTRDRALGTNGGWVSMAVPSDGSYGVEEGVFFSYPTTCDGDDNYSIVQGLEIDEFSAEKIEITKKELFEERDMVADLLR